MIINLNEIPPDGKEWTLNQKTSELNETLKDLIGGLDYSASFSIKPLSVNGTFEFRGLIKTHMPEQCSRCGIDYNMIIDEKFQHLLIPKFNNPRDAKFSKPNHFTDLHADEPDVVEYTGNVFEVSEFFHELVALAEPLIPAPPVDHQGNCSECKISLKNHNFSYDEQMEKRESPFAKLKGIKLN